MTPLVRVTLAFGLGLLAGFRLTASSAVGLAGATVLAVAAVGVGLLLWRGRRVFVPVAFCLAGASVAALRTADLAADCRTRFAEGARVRLIGVPVALPVEGLAVPVRATTLAGAGQGGCRGGVLRVHAPAGRLDELATAALGTASGLDVTGRWVAYPQRHGWPRRAEYAGAVLADTLVPAAHVRAPALARFRASRQAALRRLAPERWPLAEALLLAQKSALTSETRARWAAAGLVHLLAISGMHVGLLAAGILGVAHVAGVPRRRARRLALLLTAAYVLFLGAPHAALRALLQAALLLSALELQRPAEPFTLVAAAALAILVIDPLAVLDPGFQLSFAGIIGLVAWRRPVLLLLPRRVPAYLLEGVAAGCAASALTTPIAALHFGQAAWIGIPASIIATPVLGAAIVALLLGLLIDAVAGGVPAFVTFAVQLPLRALDLIADGAARVPGGHTYLAPSFVLFALVAVIAVILVRRLLAERETPAPPSHATDAEHERFELRGRRARIRLAVAGASGLVLLAWGPLVVRYAGDVVEIHAIDVGQGDALAIRTPKGRWLLVDTGPRTPRSDAGRDRVAPYLQRRGVRRIEAVILTHPDADHIGGAGAVLDAFDVGLVIDPGFPAGKDVFIDLLAAARSGRTRWVAARAGMRFRIDGVDVEFLFPTGSLDARPDANDNSVVFRLGFGSFAALFLGDAPASVEQQLVARHGSRLRAAVLKVGHHGSATSTSEALLDAARPSVALVSAGRRNRYGHPAPSVLRRLERHEVRVLRTDQLGNVTVRARRDARLEITARR